MVLLKPIENIEAEQAVLGSIIREGELIQECILGYDHFSAIQHQRIFEAMRKVDESGKKIDMVSVNTALGDTASEVGGVSYLAELADAVPSTANFKNYERMVLEAYRLRESRKVMVDYVTTPSDEKLDEVYQRLGTLQELNATDVKSKTDILLEIVDDLNTPRGDLTGTDTGFRDINAMTGGLQEGDLIIVAARPSMGKTAFALNLGMMNARNGGVTDIFSLEMGSKQLYQRMISATRRINGAKWRNPYRFFSQEDHQKTSLAIGIIEKWIMNIHDQARQTVFDIRAAVRKSIKDHPDKKHLVIIDYLQLITQVGRFERNDLAIGHITRELKNMAREFSVPVVLLSQLSRAVEQRQDKRPMMSDIRDSGSVEQDADVIMFLYRDDYYNADSENKNITEVILAKQRNGPTGTVELCFIKDYGVFLNLDRRHANE